MLGKRCSEDKGLKKRALHPHQQQTTQQHQQHARGRCTKLCNATTAAAQHLTGTQAATDIPAHRFKYCIHRSFPRTAATC